MGGAKHLKQRGPCLQAMDWERLEKVLDEATSLAEKLCSCLLMLRMAAHLRHDTIYKQGKDFLGAVWGALEAKLKDLSEAEKNS